jgi:hypothetical protein
LQRAFLLAFEDAGMRIDPGKVLISQKTVGKKSDIN